MASFHVTGIDAISASFEQLETLTNEEVVQLLTPAAEMYRDGYKEATRRTFKKRTGALEDSFTIVQKMADGKAFLRVYPKGKHPGTGTGKRKKKNKDGKRIRSGKYSGSNAEVAYYLNYGTPRIRPATHFIDNAADEIEPKASEATEKAWDEFLDSKGL